MLVGFKDPQAERMHGMSRPQKPLSSLCVHQPLGRGDPHLSLAVTRRIVIDTRTCQSSRIGSPFSSGNGDPGCEGSVRWASNACGDLNAAVEPLNASDCAFLNWAVSALTCPFLIHLAPELP